MRVLAKGKTFTVHAIAGTEVVLLGMDAKPNAVAGLLGFTIQRTGPKSKKKWLRGGKTFSDLQLSEKQPADSRTFPIQSMLWGDYEVDAKQKYRYAVTAQFGTPTAMEARETVEVEIETEDPDNPKIKHGIYFNRGVAGSQAYARRFGKNVRYYLSEKNGRKEWKDYIKPDGVPDREAFIWLSRGLEEGLLKFIAQAKGERYQLRACVYEFNYLPVIQAFADAVESGVDVQIIHHAKSTKKKQVGRGGVIKIVEELDSEARSALKAISEIGIRDWKNTSRWMNVVSRRTDTTIAHNKFIVLLKDGKPEQVLTGSTNFTAGGIFGQSNVLHVIREPKIAAQYLAYWEYVKAYEAQVQGLAKPGAKKVGKVPQWIIEQQADLTGPPPADSITTIFSPRPSTAMLSWYAEQLAAAKQSVHFTAAFGVSQPIGESLMGDTDGQVLRYTMLESRPSKKSSDDRKEAARAKKKPVPIDFWDLIEKPWNRVAYGDVLSRKAVEARENERKYRESLAGVNVNVDFLHTKYLLIDPLSDDPIVISGSANFSDNSTTKNDENMLIVRGDTRVADIFLTEFMRLFNHFRHRNEENQLHQKAGSEDVTTESLSPNDSWVKPYFDPKSQQYSERKLFSGSR
ncbi:phospholipase D-like domain-containing protein [Anatilimnocola floriformis]|uniref:phospholipase D-like domain-containing protein n=1 Tax=Anatilimnocola floriformis TaxID=2948575 RepID=UPI0020C1BA2D|nr:phospholipase D-like domain-containing protein [Anatilimnocola floriformis]